MTIRELERRSGLERANIRFYEKEGLLEPERKENGYRDYSEDDLQLLMKIKLLRRLGFSIEGIRSLMSGSIELEQVLERRLQAIGMQRKELNAAQQVCQEMREDGADFFTLDAQRYLDNYDRALHMPSASPSIRTAVPASDRVQAVRCPWRRYFARVLDLSIASLILWAVLALIFRVNVSSVGVIGEVLLGFVEWGIWIPLEGLLLSRWGTTPGKWIMGIRIEHEDGRRLAFGEAVERTWLVFVKGMGANIPFYRIYRLWKSYKAAKNEGDDDLEWERDTKSVQVVKERECPGWRPAAFVGVYAVSLLISVLIAMLPGFYPPHRGSELTVEEFVKNYNAMARFYGYDGDELQPDGTFGVQPEPAAGAIVVGFSNDEELVLHFEETDGILTKVAFERDISSYFIGASVDAEGKQAIMLTAMAYAWADCGPGVAYRSQQALEKFFQLDEGILSEKILDCKLTYVIAPLEDTFNEMGTIRNSNWHVKFEFVPNA